MPVLFACDLCLRKAQALRCRLELPLALKRLLGIVVLAALGAYALSLRYEQRARRCLRFLPNPNSRVFLVRELVNPGCEGWAPRDRLAWLLLDVGNDFCIRKTQAQVAKEILIGLTCCTWMSAGRLPHIESATAAVI